MKKIILICIMLLLSVIPGFSYFVELEYSSMFWEQDASLVVSRFMCLVDNQLLVLNRRIPYGRGFSELVLVSNFNIQRVLSVPLRSDDDELAGLYKTRQKDRILIEIYTNDGESYFCDYFISQQQGTLTDKLDTSMLDDSPYVTKVDSSNFPVKLSDDHLYLVQEGAPADLQIIAFWTYLNTVGVVAIPGLISLVSIMYTWIGTVQFCLTKELVRAKECKTMYSFIEKGSVVTALCYSVSAISSVYLLFRQGADLTSVLVTLGFALCAGISFFLYYQHEKLSYIKQVEAEKEDPESGDG